MDTKENAVSTDLSEISPKNLKFCPLNIRKWNKTIFWKNSPQNFPMDAEKAVSTTLLKLFFTKNRQFFVHCQQVIKKTSSKTFFQQNVLFGDVERSFDEAFGIFSTKCRKKFCSLADNDKESHFFQREHFSSQYSCGNVENAFENSIDFLNK